MVPLWAIKLMGAVFAFIIAAGAGFLAQIPAVKNRPGLVSILNTGGGGVLLTVGFVHLLPEVVEAQDDSEIEYPICFMLVLVGYSLLLMLEKVIFSHSHAPVKVTYEGIHCHAPSEECTKLTRIPSHDEKNSEEESNEPAPPPKPPQESMVTPSLLLISLGIHGIFEGLVFGLQRQESIAVGLCVAILMHKPVETLTLGAMMIKGNFSRLHYFLYILILSLITPIGTMIGLAINSADIPTILVGAFTSLTIGSFMYIATTEIIADEFHAHNMTTFDRWKLFGSFLVGLAIIAVLQVVVSEGHDHGHGLIA